jgi:ATP-binding cassette, subfamily F, member 3
VITLRDVAKSFGAQTLFENVSLQINDGDRFALVGPNGAGKSTLFKIVMGKEEPDDGEVSLRQGIRFGYLPQETSSALNGTVIEDTLGEDVTDSRREADAKKILMGLGFKVRDFDRKCQELSGGWQMRIHIARLLLDEPDMLLLDEPTNHLDLESLLWFQNHLQDYPGALFLISHDREFINAVTNRIVEVRNRRVKIYTGSFEDYLDQRRHEDEALVSAWKRQQKEIEDLETYISRFRAKASLAASVQSKIKYLEKMERIELPPEAKTVGFSFPQPARSGHNVMMLKDIRHSYDGKTFVYDGLNLTLERGMKIALVGPNGAGKSTMLKLLSGTLPFQSGERKPGFDVKVGYFSQHRAEMFRPNRTVLEEAANTHRTNPDLMVRTVLGSFLFQGDAVFKKVEVLSGGEKSRLGLARLLLDPPNLMLLDEPTTHLDMASVETLTEALQKFDGTVVLISHDVYFIRRLANQVIHINGGKITWYPGDYDYFLHKKSLEDSEEAALFRSEERIEASHHKKGPALSDARPTEKPAAGPSEEKAKGSGYKTKEQKRKEAEERNARYRAAQAALKTNSSGAPPTPQDEEKALLEEMSRPETHQNPERVAQISKRLGELQKRG